MPLEHLFDAELTYGAGMALPAEHGEGQGLRAPHEPPSSSWPHAPGGRQLRLAL